MSQNHLYNNLEFLELLRDSFRYIAHNIVRKTKKSRIKESNKLVAMGFSPSTGERIHWKLANIIQKAVWSNWITLEADGGHIYLTPVFN